MQLTVNGKTQTVDVPEDMPPLGRLRDVIGMTGTKFGCGISRVGQSNFHDYRVLRMNETPPIEVHLVRTFEHPGGIGLPGTATTAPAPAPALANAIIAATGKRLRRVPLQKALRA